MIFMADCSVSILFTLSLNRYNFVVYIYINRQYTAAVAFTFEDVLLRIRHVLCVQLAKVVLMSLVTIGEFLYVKMKMD